MKRYLFSIYISVIFLELLLRNLIIIHVKCILVNYGHTSNLTFGFGGGLQKYSKQRRYHMKI